MALGAIAGGWLLSIGVRMVFPALLPALRAAYGLDLAAAGLLLTVLWMAYALGQLPGGVLTDRLGERTVLSASTSLSAAAVAVLIMPGPTAALFFATAVFGFTTALYAVARFTVLTRLYPENVGTATGVTMAAGDVGNALLPPIAGFLAAALAWQYGFVPSVPLFVLVSAALWLTLADAPSSGDCAVDRFDSDSVRRVLDGLWQPSIRRGTAILVVGNVVWQAFTGFYPTYLVEAKGVSAGLAAGLFGLFFSLGIVMKLLAGGSYDRIGPRWTLGVVLAVAGLGFAALPFVAGLWPIVGITVLTSAFLGYGTVVLTYLTESLPTAIQGTGLGFLRTGYLLVGAPSPALVGAAANRGFFDEAFLGLAALVVVMILLVTRLDGFTGAPSRAP